MKLKLLGLGLAALLNGCNRNYDAEGEVVAIDDLYLTDLVTIENQERGTAALVVFQNLNINELHLTAHDAFRIRLGQKLRLYGCNTEAAYAQEDGAKIYVLTNCSIE